MIACEKSRDSNLSHPVTALWAYKAWISQCQNQEVPKPLEHGHCQLRLIAFIKSPAHTSLSAGSTKCPPTQSQTPSCTSTSRWGVKSGAEAIPLHPFQICEPPRKVSGDHLSLSPTACQNSRRLFGAGKTNSTTSSGSPTRVTRIFRTRAARGLRQASNRSSRLGRFLIIRACRPCSTLPPSPTLSIARRGLRSRSPWRRGSVRPPLLSLVSREGWRRRP